jgi:hypothetical protein
MRWLFFIALFLNLAYILWQVFQPATDHYADLPVSKNADSIILLSELKQKGNINSAGETDGPGQQPVELEANAAAASAEGLNSDQADIEQQDAVEEKIAEIKNDTAAVLNDPVLDGVSQAEPAEAGSCFTLGPFRDLDKLRNLIREIKSYVVKADFRSQEESYISVYWVYLQPEKNRKLAIQTGKRLKEKNIKDFYVIRKGEKNNGISLGYFKNKNRAFRLEKKVKKLGFDVLVEPIYKTYMVYWLDYQLVDGDDIPEAIFEKFSQATKTDQTSRISIDCGA